MGNLVGGQQPAVVPQNPVEQEPAYNPDNPDTHHRKRKVENTVESIETPTKKRLCSASAYIYRTLFKGGENSDITVVALGKEWRLHRHYLFQSPYFASMLQGPWEENNADKIQLQIMDENVTVTALDVVFGSLYSDEVQLEADNVCSVLVAATELHMDALLKECDTVIRENLGSKTILEYEATARQYCGSSLHEACVTWLARQLLTSCQETELCSRISPALMKLILNSKDLLMLQVEQDLYIYMRKWLYLQENPDYVEKFPTLTNLTAEYFTERFEKTDEAYLDCEIGRRFCGVMRLIRLQHILCDLAPCHTMLREGIFPRDWIAEAMSLQWIHTLDVAQNGDVQLDDASEEEFLDSCLRLGRSLRIPNSVYCWRWIGFNFGLDLLITIKDNTLSMKRNVYNQTARCLINPKSQIPAMIQLDLLRTGEDGNLHISQSTGIMKVSLSKDKEEPLLTLEESATNYPLYVSLKLLPYPVRPIDRRLRSDDSSSQILPVDMLEPLV